MAGSLVDYDGDGNVDRNSYSSRNGFAVAQREWLAGPGHDRELEFWRRQLADLPALELPLDRRRPPEATYVGARVARRTTVAR